MRLLKIIMLFFVFSLLSAEDSDIIYPELLRSYPNGTGENELQYWDYQDNYFLSVRDIYIPETGEIYIHDALNNRIVELDSEYAFKNVINYEDHSRAVNIILHEDRFLSTHTMFGIKFDIYQEKNDVNLYQLSGQVQIYDPRFLKSFLFVDPGDGETIGTFIVDKYLEGTGEIIYLNQEETLQFFNFENKDAVAGYSYAERVELGADITIDSKYRLFYNDELVPGTADEYIEYWEEYYGKERYDDPSFHLANTPYFKKIHSDVKYINNKDSRGNTYLYLTSLLLIFNNEGILLDIIRTERGAYHIAPAVHPSGDIYLINFVQNDNREWTTNLYRIKNTWDPEGRAAWYAEQSNELTPEVTQYATVNSPNLRFRDTPSLDGAQLGFLQKDQRVEVLEKSDSPVTIGEWTNFWYKVKTEEDVIGWCYGEFLDFE